MPNPRVANPRVAERAPWRSTKRGVAGVCSLLEMPTDSCHFPCTSYTPVRPQNSLTRKALSATRGLARGGLGTRQSDQISMAYNKKSPKEARLEGKCNVGAQSLETSSFAGNFRWGRQRRGKDRVAGAWPPNKYSKRDARKLAIWSPNAPNTLRAKGTLISEPRFSTPCEIRFFPREKGKTAFSSRELSRVKSEEQLVQASKESPVKRKPRESALHTRQTAASDSQSP